jgi:L-fucose mutarotase
MLKGLNPILSPELLYLLRAMGHRHELAIVDANYPCDSNAPRMIRLDGISATNVLDAVLSVLPLERAEPEVAWRMVVDGEAERNLPIFDEFRQVIAKQEGARIELTSLEPTLFKERVRQAFAVIATGERRFYGCIIVKKGLIPPG